jgi:hypothetical protein
VHEERTKLLRVARGLLRDDPEAGRGSAQGNSLAGGALALALHVPRAAAEAAVADALAELVADPEPAA